MQITTHLQRGRNEQQDERNQTFGRMNRSGLDLTADFVTGLASMTGLGGSAEHVMVPCAKISRDAQVRHVLMRNVYQHWNVHRTYNKAWETIQKGWLLPQYAENCRNVSILVDTSRAVSDYVSK